MLDVLMAERQQQQWRCEDDNYHDRHLDDQKAGDRRVGELAHPRRRASHLRRQGHCHGQRQAIEGRDEDEGYVEVGVVGGSEQCQDEQRHHRDRDLAGGGAEEVLGEEGEQPAPAKDPDHTLGVSLRMGRMGDHPPGDQEIDHGNRDEQRQHPGHEDAMSRGEQQRERQQQDLRGTEDPVFDGQPCGEPETGQHRFLECEDRPDHGRYHKDHSDQGVAVEERELTIHCGCDYDEHDANHQAQPRGEAIRLQYAPANAVVHLRQKAQDDVVEVQLADHRDRHHRRHQRAVKPQAVHRIEVSGRRPEADAEQRGQHGAGHQAPGRTVERLGRAQADASNPGDRHGLRKLAVGAGPAQGRR
jgi:hypothetical protein